MILYNIADKIDTVIKAIAVVVLAFIAPVQSILILVGFLAFGDMITGLWRSKKKNHKITSTRLSRTVSKLILYSLLILLTHGFELVFPLTEYLHITQISAGVICMVELTSVYENVSEILGNDLWKILRSKIDAFKQEDDSNTD